ncbi:hypothetical protein H4S01_001951 [Coemansia sp. RSA 2610]|nr:hypothetical protein H4S01_001951 [Coemansia sp. RSA 2610]
MLRTVFARSSRLAIPLQTAGLQRRTYVDKFQERENASENMYVHEKEKEQLAALRKKIAEVEKHANELEEHINRKEREAKSG